MKAEGISKLIIPTCKNLFFPVQKFNLPGKCSKFGQVDFYSSHSTVHTNIEQKKMFLKVLSTYLIYKDNIFFFSIITYKYLIYTQIHRERNLCYDIRSHERWSFAIRSYGRWSFLFILTLSLLRKQKPFLFCLLV